MSVYADGLLKAAVQAGVDHGRVLTRQPDDLESLMPCVVLEQIPGGGVADPRFPSTRSLVQLDAYAGSKRAAFDLCAAAVDALRAAWRTQTVYDDGWINFLDITSDSTEVRERDQPATFTRYQALLRLGFRSL